MSLEEYTEFLVKSICPENELITIKSYQKDENTNTLDVLVPKDLLGVVLGKDGKNIKAIRTLINVYAFKNEKGKVDINVESF